jgi:TonB family protein
VFHSKDGIETATVSLENSGIDVDLTLTLTQEPTKQNPDKEDEVLVIVDVHPKYPGGDEARLLFIRENIKYPQEAKEKGIQGTVYVNFVVEKDGSISNAKIARGLGGGCDDVCIRVVNLMPKWTPGKQKGKVVRVSFNMPIKFTLSTDEDKE